DPGADVRDHAVGDGVLLRPARRGHPALLRDERGAYDPPAMVAVPPLRAPSQRHAPGRDMTTRADEDLAERARKLFAGPIEFLKSAPELKFLPDPTAPEIAFAGRS